jgi:uncharacterized membrane protein YgdD (TMEM256/DUF423 family)
LNSDATPQSAAGSCREGVIWIRIGAILAALSVMFGAFAAHSLNERLPKQYAEQTRVVAGQEVPAAVKYLQDFKTGAEYQMFHSLAILVVGGLMLHFRSKGLRLAACFFLAGIILFSGSLYVLVLSGIRGLGAITPFGGVSFLLGWGALVLSLPALPKETTADTSSSTK